MDKKFSILDDNGDVNVHQFKKTLAFVVPQNKLEYLTKLCGRRPEGATLNETALFLMSCVQKEGVDLAPIIKLYQ
ncbi:unnamed protein product [Diabrotica balteata]|uniref:Uncharacterized protein n=1 Tax=Diabrotica balteata TaxID=107213 RepID=A0A9N9SXE8_DIABA|nr:unnamed protein product [Diabrotica balteata]